MASPTGRVGKFSDFPLCYTHFHILSDRFGTFNPLYTLYEPYNVLVDVVYEVLF